MDVLHLTIGLELSKLLGQYSLGLWISDVVRHS